MFSINIFQWNISGKMSTVTYYKFLSSQILLDLLECLCVLQMGIKELSELQSKLETLKEENKQAEVNLLLEQGLSREKVCLQFSLQVKNDSANSEFWIIMLPYVPLSLRWKKWEPCLWPSTTLQSSVILQHTDLWKT